ncbi:glycine betaine/proline transport system substrate-binding protein [Trueperella bonasi]|uniref:Glycine betaine/proline transport system substrate-binding protein n=1 Tax=Trueperella bonasi TaxID=312286 RepID=A0ABT9NFU7_9ACTO|nr:glycine betaine ABC transporter substrate-binding protein [Trueperella bonasi]MDP9806273.1 glycine betaine/proline transport system substrate-binding protein [Trueperella bonasi]
MFAKKAMAIGSVLALSVTLAACSSDDSGDGEAAKSVSVGVPSGWDEGVVVSHMMAIALEEQGYDVELTDADIGVVFTSIASGDMDLLFDAWLPLTHADYVEQYGDDLEDLGVWYDDAKLTIAVNNDAPITSLEELADNADVFGNEIVGIDAGAGLTQTTENAVIPQYGLEGMNFKISSTAAMLAELDSAMAAGKDIVVTLWTPHWAYGAYDIRDLEDPKGALGGAENVHTFARAGFTEDHPELAEMISNFELTAEELSDVENYALNENAGQPVDQAVGAWLEQNPEVRERMNL